MPSALRQVAVHPSIVALHSSASSGRQWAAYPDLCPSHWQWQAPDLLGYEAVPVPLDVSRLTLDIEARRIARLLSKDACTHLVAHSYGGAVALQLALRWPERIHSVTLYEPVRFGLLRRSAPELWQEILGFGNHVSELVRSGDHETSALAFVDYWSGRGSWQTLTSQRRAGVLLRMPKVRSDFEALFADELEPSALRRLRMPVRVVRGQRSPAPAREVAAIVAAHCATGELLELPDADHMTPLTEPARFAAMLLAHSAGHGQLVPER